MKRYWMVLGAVAGLIVSGCREAPLAETLEEIREQYAADPDWRAFDGVTTLTPALAQKIAERNNPDFEATLYAVNAARMRYYQAVGAYSPEISGRFEIGQNILDRDHIVNPLPTTVPYTNRFNVGASLRASWLLFDGLARELNVLASRSEYRISGSQRENVLRVLKRSVAFAYYDVLLAGEMEAIAESDIKFQESCLQQASVRFNSGFIARGDWLGFKIDLNRARTMRVQARQQREVARYALAALMGYPDGKLPPGLKLIPIADAVRKPELELEFYLNEALARRPDLRAMREAIDAARYWKYAGLSAFSPVVNAYGTVGYQRKEDWMRGYDFSRSSWDNYNYGYGITADWLIFNGLQRYNRYRELQELYEESRLQFVQTQLQVLNEVETAYTIYRSSAEIAELYRQTMDWVFEQRNLVVVEYWAGNVTITRLRGAQNDLINAEGGLAVSLIEMCKANAQLIAAVNGEVELAPLHNPETIPVLDKMFDRLEEKFGE